LHFAVRNAALSLGGIATRAGFSDETLTRELIDALPDTVLDWNAARDTIAWGLQNGRDRPLELEDRPKPQSSRSAPEGNRIRSLSASAPTHSWCSSSTRAAQA